MASSSTVGMMVFTSDSANSRRGPFWFAATWTKAVDARHRDHQAPTAYSMEKNLELALALEVRHEVELPDQVADQRDIGQQRQVVKQKAFQLGAQR